MPATAASIAAAGWVSAGLPSTKATTDVPIAAPTMPDNTLAANPRCVLDPTTIRNPPPRTTPRSRAAASARDSDMGRLLPIRDAPVDWIAHRRLASASLDIQTEASPSGQNFRIGWRR